MSFVRSHRFRSTGFALLLGPLLAHSQFNGPGTVICPNCPFPLTADMDQDGDIDLILAHPELETITWRANDGSGGFGPDLFLAVNQHHLTIELVADADDDGDIDLIGVSLAPHTDSVVAILRNAGGSFTTEIIEQPMSGERTLDQLADLDSDGDLDLLSLNIGDADVWYRNNGGGTYTSERIPHWCQPTGGGPYLVLDAEGDGDLDLVALYDVPGLPWRWMVFWNLGAARFGPFTFATPEFGPLFRRPGQGHADVNGDGLQDLVFGGRPWISLGDGRFSVPGGPVFYPFQSIANVDCGPSQEAVMSGSFLTEFYWRSLTDGTLPQAISTTRPVRTGLADLDGDGRIDLLLGDTAGVDTIWWRSNNAVPDPNVALDLGADTLVNTLVVALVGSGTPLNGGYYSGPGVYNDSLYTGLAPLGWNTITYHYLAFNNQTLCEATATDSVFIVDVTGIREFDDGRIFLYPDPAQDLVTVRWSGHGSVAIQVFDMLGQRVGVHMTNALTAEEAATIDVRALANGRYVLRIMMDGAYLGSAKLTVARDGY